MTHRGCWALVLGVLTLALVASPAPAQTTANGPYYATPSWDQTLPANTRFIVLTNFNSQAVLDRVTGLVWERTPSTQTFPAIIDPSSFDIFSSAGHCIGIAVGGQAGWRLPSIQELQSLLDITQDSGLPAGSPFVGAGGETFWSSTRASLDSNPPFFTLEFGPSSFGPGLSTNAPSQHVRVWCVRGGSGTEVQFE